MKDHTNLLALESDIWQAGILPDTGASVAYARLRHAGRWLDFMRPTPPTFSRAGECASFVMIPWSNRIRAGRFTFQGREYSVPVNAPDGTAIHGVGRGYPWQVAHAGADHVALTFRSAEHETGFPFRFRAEVEYRVEDRRFSITTRLINEDDQSMPGGFGHHPYFRRTLSGPEDTVSLEIPCSQSFALENCLPSGPPVPIEPRLDFRSLRPLDDTPIDDCLTGWDRGRPVRFRYGESGVEIALHADPIFACIILYTPPGQDHFAVEPATNANDGFNLYGQGIAGSGVFVLGPGESAEGAIRFELT